GDAHCVAVRPVAARDRRRDRPGRRHPRRRDERGAAVSGRGFLEVDDLTPAEFAAVLDVAEKGKADPSGIPQLLAGQGVVMLFEKPSARTRASTEMAVVSLGGHPIYVRPEEVGLGVRESVADVARTFAGFSSVL